MRRHLPLMGLVAMIAAGLMIATHVRAQAAGDVLVGSWKVTVTPDAAAQKAGVKAFDDTLVFKDGQFTSQACVPYGFDPAPYTATGNSFTATLHSDKEGASAWSGKVEDEKITGNNQWTKKDGTVVNFTFTGPRIR